MKSFRPKQVKKPSFDASLNDGKIRLPKQANNTLRIIPLGGMGNVTKNMWAYEYQNDIVIVDCGVGFPDEGMPGVDLVIPDITYLNDKKHKIRAILITHAHDDHIGSLPYIWPLLGNIPIYSQKLTCGLIRSKFIEHKLPKDYIKTVGLQDNLKLGSFSASFYQVSHSVPDSTGIVLRTPVGTLIHQADFKMDWTPVNGQTTDVATVARVGGTGVLMMAIDCLRVEKAGFNPSEKTIENTFENVEKATKGKVLITMTSSNITRVQQAINVAYRSGRKVALSGRSMENNFQVARDLGYLDVPPGIVIPQEETKRYPDNKQLILIAGSQGQPGSSLSRAANNDHKHIYLKKSDAVVFSADPIPGTEAEQSSLIDTLTRLGCDVYYSAMHSDLHVSGHAAAEELKVMLSLAKPKYILPIGGEYRHMKSFERMAVDLGYREDQILNAKDTQIIEISNGKARLAGPIDIKNVYVDGLGVGDVGSIILRDRQLMSEEGVVVVVVPIDQQSGMVSGEPDIISRGFVFGETAEDIIDAAREIVKSCLADKSGGQLDWRYTRQKIEEHLEKFFYGEMKRNPLIIPLVVEV